MLHLQLSTHYLPRRILLRITWSIRIEQPVTVYQRSLRSQTPAAHDGDKFIRADGFICCAGRRVCFTLPICHFYHFHSGGTANHQPSGFCLRQAACCGQTTVVTDGSSRVASSAATSAC